MSEKMENSKSVYLLGAGVNARARSAYATGIKTLPGGRITA